MRYRVVKNAGLRRAGSPICRHCGQKIWDEQCLKSVERPDNYLHIYLHKDCGEAEGVEIVS